MKLLPLFVFAFPAWLATATPAAAATPYLHAPSVESYATHNPSGVTILANGRFLEPVGRHFPIAQWPHGLAMSRDGQTLFVASAGLGQIVTDWRGSAPRIREVLPEKQKGKRRRPSAGGVDFSRDGRTIYWSGGDGGSIYLVDTASARVTSEIPLNVAVDGTNYEDSFVVDMKIDESGRHLYCADVTNFRVIVVDTELGQVIGCARVGRYPYALSVSGDRVYAANIGLFEYSAVPAPEDKRFDARGLTKPPFGYPSREAREGTYFEGRRIPGLGAPNVADSFSVWGLDVSDPRHPRVISRLKTGLLVGAPAEDGKTVGGSAPNFLVSSGDSLFVSNGNNDLIERVDLGGNQIAARERIVPSPLVAGLRGISPAGMALSPGGDRLYVAEMGINAIAVLNARTLDVLGHIPTAWYPYRVEISPDGKQLACICFRGFGNGPKGVSQKPRSDFLGMRGVLSVLDVPSDAELAALTTKVLAFNGIVDREQDRALMNSPVVSPAPGVASKEIKYVVFITKENHTYDTIFDHVPGANDDPSLLRWGLHQTSAASRASRRCATPRSWPTTTPSPASLPSATISTWSRRPPGSGTAGWSAFNRTILCR